MKRNLKEQILSLKGQGKTLLAIKNELNCSFSTIAYHLYDKTKKSTIKRIKKESRIKYARSPRGILTQKYTQFFRLGHRYKISDTKTFSLTDLQQLVSNTKVCYLSGRPLDFTKSDGYSLDHKIPLSRGGTNELSNVGICLPAINRIKSDHTPSEFITICKRIIQTVDSRQ